jgi:uncharacterized spore protein YtfJ
MPTSDESTTSTDGPDRFVHRLGERVAEFVSAGRIYGTPVERGDVTIIPVARAAFGFGGGSGSSEADGGGQGSGGGGGGVVFPVGYIEIRQGTSRFRPIVDPLLVVPLALVLIRALTRRRRHLLHR